MRASVRSGDGEHRMNTLIPKLTKSACEIFFVVLLCFVSRVPVTVGRESGGW